jgi:hypothetical protein
MSSQQDYTSLARSANWIPQWVNFWGSRCRGCAVSIHQKLIGLPSFAKLHVLLNRCHIIQMLGNASNDC